MKGIQSEISIFQLAREDDAVAIHKLVVDEHASVDERDDNGLTALHICATYGKTRACAKLLLLGANPSLPDFESGWTPLHRAFYFGHLRISLLLINAGAAVSDQTAETAGWKTDVLPKRERGRMIQNHALWKANIDHDGLSPLDLLSASLCRELQSSKKELECTSVLSFGKADFTLGISLPNSNADVLRPRRVDSLAGHSIVQLSASKHHSVALTREGGVYSWGHGRGGRLGHGDEVTQPEPQIIRSLSSLVIRMICAAENHTLAVTHAGGLYTWGSNRFGQLGHGGSDAGKSSFSPKRVESLKKVTVVAVAAGDAHSVCFTENGEIYSWGSNKHGQLGISNSDLGPCLSGTGYGTATPKRVYLRGVKSASKTAKQNTLYNLHNHSNRGSSHYQSNPIVQVAASRYSTLVLCRAENRWSEGRSGRAAAPNEVYQWGHGSPFPSKVQFSRRSESISMSSSLIGSGSAAASASASVVVAAAAVVGSGGAASSSSGGGGVAGRKLSGSEDREALLNRYFGNRVFALVSIVQLTAGLYHNAALSSEGHVYTWGLGSDQLGHGPEENRLSTPQLLETLLPENGGGRAVLVSAACNRTCVVSDVGDLYTWGATSSQGVLGHGAGSHQPIPKLVGGVKRAVCVAGGEDHTLVLTSASLPSLPYSDLLPQQSETKKSDATAHDCLGLVVVAGADPGGRRGGYVRVSTSTTTGSGGGVLGVLAVSSSSEEESTEEDEDGGDHDDDASSDSQGSEADSNPINGNGDNNDNEHDDATEDGQTLVASSDNDNAAALGFGSPTQAADNRNESSRKATAAATATGATERMLTLAELCERKIAESVDTRNCIAILARAEAVHATGLSSFCAKFILRNLDAILVQSRSSDLETLIQDLNWSGPGSTALATARRASIDKTFADRRPSAAAADGSGISSIVPGKSTIVPGRQFPLVEVVGHRPSSGSVSGGLFSPEGEALLSACRPRSGSKDLDTAASVMKVVRSVKKKLQSIEELEVKLRDKAIDQLNDEQQEKVDRKSTLQAELKRLGILLARLEGEERVKEQAKISREKLLLLPAPISEKAVESSFSRTSAVVAAVSKVPSGGAQLKSEVKKDASSSFSKSLNSVPVPGCKSPSKQPPNTTATTSTGTNIDTGSAGLTTPVKAPSSGKNATTTQPALTTSAAPSTSLTSASSTGNQKQKQKTKFISLEEFQQKSTVSASMSGPSVPSFTDWMKAVDTTSNTSNTSTTVTVNAATASGSKSFAPTTAGTVVATVPWGGAGFAGKVSAASSSSSSSGKSLKEIVQEQASSSKTTSTAAISTSSGSGISISSSAMNGRTVLSPPTGAPPTAPPSAPVSVFAPPASASSSKSVSSSLVSRATMGALAAPVTTTSLSARKNSGIPAAAVTALPGTVNNGIKQPIGLISTPTKSLSAPPPLYKSPAAQTQTLSPSPTGHSLLDFITPRKDKGSSSSSASSSAATAAIFGAGYRSSSQTATPLQVQSPWAASPPPSTGTCSISSSASSPRVTGDKPKSLAEIQSEEEAARLVSNIQSLKGNENPWLIERRKRADSIEEVVRSQREEKIREEEEIKRRQEEHETAERVKREKKEREKEKQMKKQQRDKEREKKVSATATAVGGSSPAGPPEEREDKSQPKKESTAKKQKKQDGSKESRQQQQLQHSAASTAGASGDGGGRGKRKSTKDHGRPVGGGSAAVEAASGIADAANAGGGAIECTPPSSKNHSQPRKSRSATAATATAVMTSPHDANANASADINTTTSSAQKQNPRNRQQRQQQPRGEKKKLNPESSEQGGAGAAGDANANSHSRHVLPSSEL